MSEDDVKKEHTVLINEFVELVIERFKPVSIKGDKEELYFFYDGYYHRDAPSDLKHISDKFFREKGHTDLVNPGTYGLILHKVKSHHMIEMDLFVEPKDKINLRSGVLDIRTKEVEDHYIFDDEGKLIDISDTYKYHFLYRLDIDYNPNANCPNIIKFLMEFSDYDMNKYWCFIEFFGFILISDYLNIKKYMLLYGKGDNGKSVLEQLLITFLTSRNVAGLSFQQICDRDFMASKLHEKKLNIRGEMSQIKVTSMDKLKSFTGGDTVTLDRKYKDPIHFRNTSKIIFHFNELPNIDINKMDEQSWKRMLFIVLTKRFLGKDDDKNLIEKLTTTEELEGFLNLCLEGLERLIRNKKFTYDDDSTFENWLEAMPNELDDFIDGRLKITANPEDFIPTEELYRKFMSWNGHSSMTKTKFSQLITKYPSVGIKKRGKVGEQVKCYVGLCYINN